jgi:hypothetical protein
MSNALIKIDEIKKSLATITRVEDARKLLSIAEGLLIATRKEYKASNVAGEVIEDRDRAYSTAVKAGELRLLAEAKLGELLKSEKEKGVRAKSSTDGTLRLKDYGIDKKDSFRAQRIADHQDLIPQAIEKAIKRGEIPTRRDVEHAIFEVERKASKNALPPMTVELMPKTEERRIKMERNVKRKMWRVSIGPNEAGVKLKEHVEEMRHRPNFLQMKNQIDELNEKAKELREKADELEAEGREIQNWLKSGLKIQLEKEFGPAYTHTETIEFSVSDEKIDEYIATLPVSEVVEFLFQPNDQIVVWERGYWGDIRDLEFSQTKIERSPGSRWTRIGWGD